MSRGQRSTSSSSPRDTCSPRRSRSIRSSAAHDRAAASAADARAAPLAALASLANSACPAARSSKRSRMPSQTARSRSARTTSCAQRSSAVTIGMRAWTLAMIAACTAAERRFSRRARIACSAHAKITSTRPQRAALRALLRSPHVRWPAQHRQSPFSSSVTREERKGLYFLHRLIWREDHDARPCEEARYQLLAQRPFLVEALAVVTREDRRKIISTESEYSSSNRRDRSSNQRTPGRASAPNRTRAARRPIRSGARRAEVLADETAASALTRRGRRHLPSHVKAGAARLIPAHRAASAHTAASRVVRTSAGDRRTIAMLILRPQAKL